MRDYKPLQAPRGYKPYTDNVVTTGNFYGINRGLTVQDGEMNESTNLTSDYFPQMAPVLPKVKVHDYDMQGGTYRGSIAKGNDVYSFCGGRMYKNGKHVEAVNDGELTDAGNGNDERKLIVSMGAYILVWPDKWYYNTTDPDDHGKMGNAWSQGETVTFSPCTLNGTVIEGGEYVIQSSKPTTTTNGSYWFDTKNQKLMVYASSSKSWQEVQTTYIRIGCAGIGHGFKLNDSIVMASTGGGDLFDAESASGQQQKDMKAINAMVGTAYVVYAVEEDFIVITGLVSSALTTNTLKVERRIPDFSYACEANNRVWGCQYGTEMSMDGSFVNQLMACALGDFRNWETYDQVSTDSYAVSMGSDGPFTGAIGLNGIPCFFKEGNLTRIGGQIPVNFSTNATSCRGVDAGDSRSLQRIEQSLVYKAIDDILLFDSGSFRSIGMRLGATTLAGNTLASAVHGMKYYIALPDGIYVYDYQRGFWEREDLGNIVDLISTDEDMMFLVEGENGLQLWRQSKEAENLKSNVKWSATFGAYGYDLKNKKYLTRFDLRMQMKIGSSCAVFIQYDHDGRWHKIGDIKGKTINSFLIPVMPRRCDHCQLRLDGTGYMRLISLSRILEQGSDA